MDPYEILGVAPNANDDVIRKAYLELVRRFSPDTDPEAFKSLSNAYEQVKDEKRRLRHYLFNKDTPGGSPFQAFLMHVAAKEQPKPMNDNQMKDFLRKCAKN